MTGATAGVIAAVAGNDMTTNRAAIVPVNADGTLGTPVDDGAVHTHSSLVNIGDALAIVNDAPTTKCTVETIGLAITAHGAQTGWGTAGDCSQPRSATRRAASTRCSSATTSATTISTT